MKMITILLTTITTLLISMNFMELLTGTLLGNQQATVIKVTKKKQTKLKKLWTAIKIENVRKCASLIQYFSIRYCDMEVEFLICMLGCLAC